MGHLLVCSHKCLQPYLQKNYTKEKFNFVGGLLHSYGILFDIEESDLKKYQKKALLLSSPITLWDLSMVFYYCI